MKKVTIVFGIVMVLISGIIVVGLARSKGERNEKSLICPTFPAGIFLCKEQIKITESWADVQNFKYEPEWKQREILRESGQLLTEISANSCRVITQGNIQSEFDNKISDIFFIPAVEGIAKEEYTRLYGAILYEEKGFKGKSQVICKYPEYIGGVFIAQHEPVGISKPSSIKPYEIIFGPNPDWKVTLYEKPSLNKFSSLGTKEVSYGLGDKYTYYKEFNLDWSPQSIKIKGELIAILTEPTGGSEVFKKTEEKLSGSTATKLIVISGKIY